MRNNIACPRRHFGDRTLRQIGDIDCNLTYSGRLDMYSYKSAGKFSINPGMEECREVEGADLPQSLNSASGARLWDLRPYLPNSANTWMSMLFTDSMPLSPLLSRKELDRIACDGHLESSNTVNGSDIFLQYCQCVSRTFRGKDNRNVWSARHDLYDIDTRQGDRVAQAREASHVSITCPGRGPWVLNNAQVLNTNIHVTASPAWRTAVHRTWLALH
jgi:hypothetical protein